MTSRTDSLDALGFAHSLFFEISPFVQGSQKQRKQLFGAKAALSKVKVLLFSVAFLLLSCGVVPGTIQDRNMKKQGPETRLVSANLGFPLLLQSTRAFLHM